MLKKGKRNNLKKAKRQLKHISETFCGQRRTLRAGSALNGYQLKPKGWIACSWKDGALVLPSSSPTVFLSFLCSVSPSLSSTGFSASTYRTQVVSGRFILPLISNLNVHPGFCDTALLLFYCHISFIKGYIHAVALDWIGLKPIWNWIERVSYYRYSLKTKCYLEQQKKTKKERKRETHSDMTLVRSACVVCCVSLTVDSSCHQKKVPFKR